MTPAAPVAVVAGSPSQASASSPAEDDGTSSTAGAVTLEPAVAAAEILT